MITQEEKAKIFALYWAQPVYQISKSELPNIYNVCDLSLRHPTVRDGHLLLTPLSSITDEDAIEVAKIMTFHDGKGIIIERKKNGDIEMYDRYNDEPHFVNTLFFVPYPFEIFSRNDNGNWFQYDAERFIEITDFLRSRGYALPAFGHSVDELVQEGIFKLIEP